MSAIFTVSRLKFSNSLLGTTYDTSLDIHIQCQIGAWCNFLNQAVLDPTVPQRHTGSWKILWKWLIFYVMAKCVGDPMGLKVHSN